VLGVDLSIQFVEPRGITEQNFFPILGWDARQ
jgi:hypothetical protein